MRISTFFPCDVRSDFRVSAFGLQEFNVNDDLLVTIQKNLYALKEFLDKNPYLFHSTPGDPAASRNTEGHEQQEAWKVCLGPLSQS